MKLLGHDKPIFGVVHLAPLPGAPGYGGAIAPILARARRDAETYLEGGLQGILVENYGDQPFYRSAVGPETVAALTAAARAVRALGDFPLGVNVLRNDARAALAAAAAAEAQFIRVNVLAGTMLTDQGLIEGPAADLLRQRAAWGVGVKVWADLLVKHAVPLAPLDPVEVARDLTERAGADALIVTGSRTGAPADPARLAALRRAAPGPWLVGSGITPSTFATYAHAADGFIVATALERDGRSGAEVELERVRALARARAEFLAAPEDHPASAAPRAGARDAKR